MKKRIIDVFLELFEGWQNWIGSAGFPACCVADFPVGRRSKILTRVQVGNLRYGAVSSCLRPLLVTLFLLPVLLRGAVAPAPAPDATATNVPEPTVIERGPHHRTWQTVRAVKVGDKTVLRTNTYQEMAIGMHFVKNGELVEATETINIVNGNGFAEGQHRALWSPSITNTPAVTYEDPDLNRFESRPMGLVWLDYQSGKSVLFCVTKDSIGTVNANQVIYPDAFSDGVQCNIRYVFKRDSFAQEIDILAQF